MRLVTLLAGAVAALALLCQAPAEAQTKQKLRFFTNFDAATVKRWEPILAEYEKRNPQVDVDLETVAGSGAAIYPDVLRTSIAAGDPPDVFFMWGGEIAGPFIDAGQVMDLEAYYKKYEWEKILTPWTVKAITRNGKIWGVPFNARGMGFFYRKDIFAKYKITEPKSYAELEKVCDTLKKEGIYCASFGGKFGWHPMRLLDYFIETDCGPAEHDKLNRLEASWAQPCAISAYSKLKKWVDNGWLVPDFLNVSPADARMPVYVGDAAMIIEGDWFEGTVRGDKQKTDNLDFFLPPTGHTPQRYSAFPQQWMIPAKAKNPELSAQFVDFIIRADNQKLAPEAFVASATVGVEPDCAVWPITCKWRKIITGESQIFPPTDQAFRKELMDGFFEVQANIIAGKTTPEAGAKQMQEKAEQWKATKG